MSKIFDEYAEARLKNSGRPTAAERIDAWLARGKIGQHQAEPPIYTGKQATNCAVCGEYKHTPLRVDHMGGYVCLTCIDKELAKPDQRPEPALVQMRMRPMWREEGGGWTEWGNITEAAAQEYERHPVYQEWQYEVRRLYLGAQPGQRAGVAEGWKLVPVEPTDEMRQAAYDAFIAQSKKRNGLVEAYRAALAAAPTPAAQERGEPQ